MLERIQNWLRDDSVPEEASDQGDRGWGLSLWWGAVIVALFTVVITLCNVPGDGDVVAGTATTTTSTAPPPPVTTVPLSPSDPTVPEVIAGRSDLTTFNSLIDLAGIRQVLADNGTFTFFAPTDDVFNALPSDVLTYITTNPEAANQVLQTHAAFGPLPAAELLTLGSIESVFRQMILITESGGVVYIDDAGVVEADIPSSNGFIHTIDALLGDPIEVPPPTARPLGQILSERDDLSTLVTALQAATEGELNIGDAGFTLFAPTNAAFEQLPAGSVEVLMSTQPKLFELLGYHIVDGRVLAADLTDGQILISSSGAELPVTVSADGVTVGGAAVTETDIVGEDGVIHIVDTVLMPPGFTLPTINEALSLEPVTFETGSAVITPEGVVVLQSALDFLNANEGTRVAIEGHTDDQGGEEANLLLSEARAAAVRDYLVSQGVDADRLETAGFGESQPIADNSTPEGRAQNRRIEFRLL